MFFGKKICIELTMKRKTSLKTFSLEESLRSVRFLRPLRSLSGKKVECLFVTCKCLVLCVQEQ